MANGGNLIKPHVMKEVGRFDEEKNKEIIEKKNTIDSKQVLNNNKMAT